jgi:hypothetical protein
MHEGTLAHPKARRNIRGKYDLRPRGMPVGSAHQVISRRAIRHPYVRTTNSRASVSSLSKQNSGSRDRRISNTRFKLAKDLKPPFVQARNRRNGAAQLPNAADARPLAGSGLKPLFYICATASRQLQIASANAIVRRGNCRAASLRSARWPRAADWSVR